MNVQELETKLNIELDAWQRSFVLDQKPAIVLKFGRKCGKTTAIAFRVVLETHNKGWKVLILSRGQRQSGEVFREIRQMLHHIKAKIVYESQTRVELENGHTIYCLPSGHAGITLRTYSFHKIYYDEAAYLTNDVYDATTPCLAVNGIQRVLASTPAGTSGFFYDEWHNPEFQRYEGSTKACSRVSAQWLLAEKRRMTKAQYDQEYNAKFTDLADGLIRSPLIYSCIKEGGFTWDDMKEGPVFLGVDFARFGQDDNVIAYCNYRDKKAFIKVEVHKGRHRLTSIIGRIKAISNKFPNIRKIVTDEGGIGAGPTDELTMMFGKRKVVGIQNQQRSKEAREQGRPPRYVKHDLYSNLIYLMENGKIVLDDDINIIRSLKQVKYRYTKEGLLSIYGQSHHIAEAIVRAVFPLLGYKEKQFFIHAEPHKRESIFNIEAKYGWEVPLPWANTG
jgi:hypothetical protein